LVGDIMVTGALKGDYSSNITLTDEGIRKLAASGRICEVLGFHCWETDWTDAFHAIYNPEGRSQSRKCRICGTNETYTGGVEMKSWKPWPGCDCPDCGSNTEVFTKCKKEGYTIDTDPVRCSDPACPRHTEDLGWTIVYEEDSVATAFDSWPIGDDNKPCKPEDTQMIAKNKAKCGAGGDCFVEIVHSFDGKVVKQMGPQDSK